MPKAHQNEFDFVVEYAKDAVIPSVVEDYLTDSSSFLSDESRALIEKIGGSIVGSEARHTSGTTLDLEQFKTRSSINKD